MQERAVFLDRDNTIIANDGYLGDPGKVKLLPGAGLTLASLQRIGYRIIVVSNQSGVARGLFRTSDVDAVNQEMGRQLRQQAGAQIDASYFCPFHPDAVVAQYRGDHEWRKPRPGMLKQAAIDFNLDLHQCWMVGDQPRDIAAGAAVGCRTIWLKDVAATPAKKDDAVEPTVQPVIQPDFVVKSLADAARIIVREGAHVIKPPTASAATVNIPGTVPSAEPPAEVQLELPPVAVPASSPPALNPGQTAAPMGRSAVSLNLLEEIAGHIRQINRRTQSSEFSFWSLMAMIVQMVVVLFLALALWDGLVAGTYLQSTDINWWFDRTSSQLGALEWLVAALVLQGVVLGIHLMQRNR